MKFFLLHMTHIFHIKSRNLFGALIMLRLLDGQGFPYPLRQLPNAQKLKSLHSSDPLHCRKLRQREVQQA